MNIWGTQLTQRTPKYTQETEFLPIKKEKKEGQILHFQLLSDSELNEPEKKFLNEVSD
jgi:hypothetical protein